MDDERITELFENRSEDAITELSRKYGLKLKKIAKNILNNEEDADECMNDAYLALWNSIPPEKPSPLLTYASAVVRNLALKKYHKNTAQKRNSIYDVCLDEIGEFVPSDSSITDELKAKEITLKINCFLEELDRQSRIIFVRRYWYADSVKDISAMFNQSAHYISVRLSRIRKSLKEYLEKEGVIQ